MNTTINKDIVFIEEDLEELIPNFFKNREKEIFSLSKAIDLEHYSQMTEIAHALKGTSGSYGFQYMYTLAKEIEFAAKENNLDLVKTKLTELKIHYHNIEIIFQ